MKCAICGSVKRVQKHHILYQPEYIQLLCISCHKKVHDGRSVGVASEEGARPICRGQKMFRIYRSVFGVMRAVGWICVVCNKVVIDKNMTDDRAEILQDATELSE